MSDLAWELEPLPPCGSLSQAAALAFRCKDAMKKIILSLFLLACLPCFASSPPCPTSTTPTGYPTVCSAVAIAQYTIVKSGGFGSVVAATSDATYLEGITQSAVIKPSVGRLSQVVIATSSQVSYVQVGASVAIGSIVTSDANGNAITFAPLADGNRHCALGTAVAVGPGGGNAGDFIQVNIAPFCLIAPVAAATVPNFADNETPAGTINGSNVTFTLAHTPNPPGSLLLISCNGSLAPIVQLFFQSTDPIQGYSLSGATITFVTAPSATCADGSSAMRAWYRY